MNIPRKKKRPIKKVKDPIKLIKGILSEYKGKYTSVELQHEASKIWAESAMRYKKKK